VAVFVTVLVLVGEDVDVLVEVRVAVEVWVTVGVSVTLGVCVTVRVCVGVSVCVTVAVFVTVRVGVDVQAALVMVSVSPVRSGFSLLVPSTMLVSVPPPVSQVRSVVPDAHWSTVKVAV